MSENQIQSQIDLLNAKMDLILEEISIQKSSRIAREDLMSEVSTIGKDVLHNSLKTLDDANIELNADEIYTLLVKFARNIGTFNQMMDTLESVNDFIKDAAPIIKQIGYDTVEKFAEFDKKGYFDFGRELLNIGDKFLANYSSEDLKMLSEKIPVLTEMLKNITQSDLLPALNTTLAVYKNMENQKIPKYSMWKAFKAMNSPEMKQNLGFMITFMQNLNKTLNKKS